MGGDGGSIPGRADLVRTRATTPPPDPYAVTAARWHFCALSKAPLAPPIVASGLGRLYNKEAVVTYLLDRDTYGDADQLVGHIRSLRDVVTLNLTPNAAFEAAAEDVDEGLQLRMSRSRFVCPITQKELNGQMRYALPSVASATFM